MLNVTVYHPIVLESSRVPGTRIPAYLSRDEVANIIKLPPHDDCPQIWYMTRVSTAHLQLASDGRGYPVMA